MDSGQVEKDEERKWLRSDDIDSIENVNEEELTHLTFLHLKKNECFVHFLKYSKTSIEYVKH